MNNSLNASADRRRKRTKWTTAGGGAIALLIVLYALLQPMLSEHLGIDLPKALNHWDSEAPATADIERSEEAERGANRDLRYGILQPIERDSFISPAGLRYAPGSRDGHRLKHLQRHTEDQPDRPGRHGVFAGGMETTLAVLDQAYEKALQGGRGITKTQDDRRTIYTVDMGRRIGYVGGRDGNRAGKPPADRVRIVMEGDRVITAYPL